MKNIDLFKVDKNSLTYKDYRITIHCVKDNKKNSYIQFVVIYKDCTVWVSDKYDSLEYTIEIVLELDRLNSVEK